MSLHELTDEEWERILVQRTIAEQNKWFNQGLQVAIDKVDYLASERRATPNSQKLYIDT